MQLVKQQNLSEGWAEYKARWRPGTCPQESHIVHLTGLVTKEPLTEYAYQDLLEVIEQGESPGERDAYEDKHFSEIRTWNPKADATKGAAYDNPHIYEMGVNYD